MPRLLAHKREVLFCASGMHILAFNVWTGQTLNHFKGHSGKVTCIKVQGDFLYSSSEDATVRQWNIKTAKTTRIFRGHSSRITSFDISGTYMYTASQRARKWNIETGQTIRTFEGHDKELTTIHCDGNLLYTGADDKKICQWNATNGDLIRTLRGHRGKVTALCTSDDHALFSGGSDSYVLQWSAEQGHPVKLYKGHTGRVTDIEWKDGYLFSASAHSVRRWGVESGRTEQVFKGHQEKVVSVHIHHAYLFSASGGYSGEGPPGSGSDYAKTTVHQWKVETGKNVYIYKDYSHHPIALHVHNGALWTGSYEATVRKWDLENGRTLSRFKGHHDHILAIVLDGNYAYTGSLDRSVRKWNIKTGKMEMVFRGHKRGVHALQVGGRYVYSGSYDRTVRKWDTKTGKIDQIFHGHSHMITDIQMANKNKTMYTASWDRKIRKWNVNKTKTFQTLRGHKKPVLALEPQGDYLFSGSLDKDVRMWNASTGRTLKIFRGHTAAVTAIQVVGDYMYTGSVDTQILQWNIDKNALVGVFRLHDSAVTDLEVRGTTLFSASSRGMKSSSLLVKSMFGVNTSLDFDTYNPIVSTKGGDHHAHETNLQQFNRVSSTYGPLWMFFLNILLMLLDFVQLGSFAFLQNLTWGFPGIASSFFNVRYLGFLSGNFDTSFIVAVFLVVLFTIVMSVQEWIEWRHMTHPTSFSFTFLWAFVKFFTSMISRPLFLGILGTLLTAYDCQAVAGTEAASGGADYVLDAVNHPDDKLCWEGAHWLTIFVAPVAGFVYVGICIRLMLAGNELSRLDVKKNIFNWSDDNIDPIVYEHPFSFHGVFGPRYLLGVLAAKTVLVVSAIFFSTSTLTILWISVFVAIALIVLTFVWRPYHHQHTNEIRWALDWGLLWVFICGLSVRLFLDGSVGLTLLPTILFVFLVLGYLGMSFAQAFCLHSSRLLPPAEIIITQRGSSSYDTTSRTSVGSSTAPGSSSTSGTSHGMPHVRKRRRRRRDKSGAGSDYITDSFSFENASDPENTIDRTAGSYKKRTKKKVRRRRTSASASASSTLGGRSRSPSASRGTVGSTTTGDLQFSEEEFGLAHVLPSLETPRPAFADPIPQSGLSGTDTHGGAVSRSEPAGVNREGKQRRRRKRRKKPPSDMSAVSAATDASGVSALTDASTAATPTEVSDATGGNTIRKKKKKKKRRRSSATSTPGSALEVATATSGDASDDNASAATSVGGTSQRKKKKRKRRKKATDATIEASALTSPSSVSAASSTSAVGSSSADVSSAADASATSAASSATTTTRRRKKKKKRRTSCSSAASSSSDAAPMTKSAAMTTVDTEGSTELGNYFGAEDLGDHKAIQHQLGFRTLED